MSIRSVQLFVVLADDGPRRLTWEHYLDLTICFAAIAVRNSDADVQTYGVSRSIVLALTSAYCFGSNRPRVILVVKEGKLLGLVTVKDVLRHEAAVEHMHRQQESSVSPNSSSFQDWRDTVFNMEENAAGLEVVLEELLNFVKAIGKGAKSSLASVLGRFGGSVGANGTGSRLNGAARYGFQDGRARDSNHEPRGEEFELGEDEDA